MSAERQFLDTNVILYLLSDDDMKAGCAEALLTEGCVISVQVLNELANVATRKLRLGWPAVEDILSLVRGLTEVVPVTVGIHQLGLTIAARHGYPIYDSMIIAAATDAGCETLWTEDMQAGQRIEHLTLCNPFQP